MPQALSLRLRMGCACLPLVRACRKPPRLSGAAAARAVARHCSLSRRCLRRSSCRNRADWQ
eukprot:6203409-Pleurochrysis_carterae.AAC.1